MAAQRHYCSKNEIEHYMCSYLGVTGLTCDDVTINRFYQLALAWVIGGNYMALLFNSYVLIFHSVIRLNSAAAIIKALSTYSSHLILIFFFYTTTVVVSTAHLARKAVPIFPVFLNVLNIIIPQPLTPWYMHFLRVPGLDKNVSQK